MEKQLQEILSAVKSVVESKSVTEQEVKDQKELLDSVKSQLEQSESKSTELEAQVKALAESLEAMEEKQLKGKRPVMEAQVKEKLNLNKEIKSLAIANPQQDIISKGLVTTDTESAGVTIRTAYEEAIIKPLRERSAFLSEIGFKSVPNEDFKRLVKVKDAEMRWGGENTTNAALQNTGTQGYAEVSGTYGKAESYPFISDEMLHDSHFDLVSELSESVLDEIAIGVAAAALKGDGVKKPKGLLQHTTGADHEKFEVQEIGSAGKLPAATKDILKMLRAVARSLKTGYRANAKWIMNETMRDALAGYTYTDGRSIINEDVAEMPEGKLLGKQIVVDPEMPDGTFTYGDHQRGFTFLSVEGMKVLPNPYVAPGNTQFYHATRVGTIVGDVKAVKIVKIKTA